MMTLLTMSLHMINSAVVLAFLVLSEADGTYVLVLVMQLRMMFASIDRALTMLLPVYNSIGSYIYFLKPIVLLTRYHPCGGINCYLHFHHISLTVFVRTCDFALK